MKNPHDSFANGSYTGFELALHYGLALGNTKLAKWNDRFDEEADRLDFLRRLADQLDAQANWEETHDWYHAVDAIVADITILSDTDDATLAELVRLVLRRDTVQQ